MIDGLYEDYSKRGSKCYSTFAGGGFLGAGDLNLLSKEYRGLPALLVRNAPDAEMSHERLQAVSYTLAIPASPHTGDALRNPPLARSFGTGSAQTQFPPQLSETTLNHRSCCRCRHRRITPPPVTRRYSTCAIRSTATRS